MRSVLICNCNSFPSPLQYSLLSQRNPVSIMISELENGLHPELPVYHQHSTVEFSCTNRDWLDVFVLIMRMSQWVLTNNTLSILDAHSMIIWV